VHLVAVVGIAVALGQAHDHAQRAAARDDRGLVDRVRSGLEDRDDGVTGLVVGGHLLFFFGHDHRAALGAHHHLVLGVLELAHGDKALVAARGQQGGLVDEVGKIGAREAGVPRAITRGLTSGASGTFFMWTARIFSRPSMSGTGTTT
jgi:hypothetical protein